MSSPSTELVPQTDALAVYNMMNGTKLEHHNDILTAEQARQINAAYDIEIHVGTHGTRLKATADPLDQVAITTQQEYEAAGRVVKSMRPGDTLFLEGPGFSEQPSESLIIPDPEEADDSIRSRFYNFRLMAAADMKVKAHRTLEAARWGYKLDAWDYARQLAWLEGINTVRADHDAFEVEALETASQGKGLRELRTSPDEQDRALADRIYTLRERKACNTIKDYALKNLPPAGSPPPERKPKLVLLFGSRHAEGLAQAMQNLGLQAEIIPMEATENMSERAKEQIMRLTGEFMVEYALRIAQEQSEQPPDNTSNDT